MQMNNPLEGLLYKYWKSQGIVYPAFDASKHVMMTFSPGDVVKLNGDEVIVKEVSGSASLILYPNGIATWVDNHLLNKEPIATKPAWCYHTYVPYIGLTETYNYCNKCNKKESEA